MAAVGDTTEAYFYSILFKLIAARAMDDSQSNMTNLVGPFVD